MPPSQKKSEKYFEMAEESLNVLDIRSDLWKATITYYTFYYSLYAILMLIGVKSEIHSCTIEFMRTCLNEYYSKNDMKSIEKAFTLRKDMQYYAKTSDKDILEENARKASIFYDKTRMIAAQLDSDNMQRIRSHII